MKFYYENYLGDCGFFVENDLVKPINAEKEDKETKRIKEFIESAKTKDELKQVADKLPSELIEIYNQKLVTLK
jgi:hypothetical protein